ncbi:AAA family ATPase [Microbacterium sp. GXF6406]
MRLHRLDIQGFGPFLDRQTVDFDRFADDGIFLIAGRTGAGKSSILDAVCFGLYGGVPRYESGDKRLRSDHCAPEHVSEVVVEFSTAAGRFRVTRSPEYLRPAKRGGGMTKQAPAVALEQWIDDAWVGLAARAVDVAGELDGILQLSREQFLQVILLAQNRFARFLLADSKERQSLLRKLFGTERFDDVQARFEARRREAENALTGRTATIEAGLAQAERLVTNADLWGGHEPSDSAQPAPQRLDGLRAAQQRADDRVVRTASGRDEESVRLNAAEAAVARAREVRAAQQEREEVRAIIARLDAAEPEVVLARSNLKRAREAEALRAVLDAAQRAERESERTLQDEAAAREAWQRDDGSCGDDDLDTHENDPARLEGYADRRTTQSGTWQRAADLEKAASARAAEIEAVQKQIDSAFARLEAHDAERAGLPERIAALTVQRDDARRAADRLDERRREVSVATARRDAALEAEKLGAEAEAAERSVVDAGETLAAAQSALALLRRRRLEGYAGELAASLLPDEPCAVCGSREHPAPAEHSDPVSQTDIDAAENARDEAARAERVALDRLSTSRSDHAARLAVADGRTPQSAAVELEELSAALNVAQSAVGLLAETDDELARVIARTEELEHDRAALVDALTAAREARALTQQRHADAEQTIAEALGGFASVAERLDIVSTRISAARALAGALREVQRSKKAAVEAAEALEIALAASDFASADAVRQALRSSVEQQELDERITAHTVQRETQRERLHALDERALPDEEIDLTGILQAQTDARDAWTTALDAAARAESIAEQLRDLIAAADAAHAESAREHEEFEVLRGLADTIAGRGPNTHKMALETFVLAAELEEIVRAANRRLSDMSTGRYQLRHSDALAARGAASGLGIVVYDAFTGQERPAQSLSGGETFLSSLALALGLAEVVTARAGGIQLDTLFIDEGFGSLDADTLEVAMRTLDELRSGGRTVGVISHVESMQEQIPAQIVVAQSELGPSIIR